MAANSTIEISTLFNKDYQLECVKELDHVEFKILKDEFKCIAQHVADTNGRFFVIVPDSTVDFDGQSPPVGAMKYDFKKDSGNSNVHIHAMYQHLPMAAYYSQKKFHFMKELGHLGIAAYAGIYSTIANAIYHPGASINSDVTGDFKFYAANIGNIIYICNPPSERDLDSSTNMINAGEDEKIRKSKMYRIPVGKFTIGIRNSTSINVLTYAETDDYHTDGKPIEDKAPNKNEKEFWGADEYGEMHRTLQNYLKMKLSNVEYIHYKTLDQQSKFLTAQKLRDLGIKGRGNVILKNMEYFLAKVLKEVQGVLKDEGHYCEIQFIRKTDHRKTEGSGKFTITGKGPIEGPVLLNQFKATFNL